MALANRLLTHYSPSLHSLEDDSVGGRQCTGGCALLGSKGSYQMQPYPQSVPFTPTDQNHDTQQAPNCNRNSRNLAMGGRWTIGENMAHSSNVSAEAFIGVIAAMDTGLQSDLSQWMESICSVASE